MADAQLLEILQRGVNVWNEWKKENPEAKADLRGAFLVGLDLRSANLSGADLSDAQMPGAYLDRAQLAGVVLDGAKLFRAHLGAANLRNANLEKADLGGAHLADADLTGANLGGAHLRGTNFYGAALSGADFSKAQVGRTIFGNLDLRQVKGLDSLIHSESSTIGMDTYWKSHGQIPRSFLQSAGIPEGLLAHLDLLANQFDVFSPKSVEK